MQVAGVPEAVGAVAGLRAALDRFVAADLSVLSADELLSVMGEVEAVGCQLPAVWHRMLAGVQRVALPRELGAKNWKQVLALRLRISTGEAHRRLVAAAVLGPRTAVGGEALAPEFPALAAAQAHGAVNAEHVAVVRDAVVEVRARVDAVTAAQVELELVRTALTVGPKELAGVAARRLAQLDQDGPERDERERVRSRGVRTGRQRRNGNTPIAVEAAPALATSLGAFFAKFAAPGMCNPDDLQPCVSGTPSRAQIDGDHRTHQQRQHDALEVMARIALSSDLGRLHGLPVSVIVKTTLAELQAMAGVAVAGDGTRMSIAEVIRLGAHAHWSLAVFDGAGGSALDLFRTRRVASAEQRLMLIARDWGCTKPGCPAGPYDCQVHHAVADWRDEGNTNVDENALACGPDNRLVGPGPDRWRTDVIGGVAHWYPPAGLDTGQATVNYLHRPELIPVPEENAPLPWDTPPRDDAAHDPDPDPDPDPEPEPGSGCGVWDPDAPPFPAVPVTPTPVVPDDGFLAAWMVATRDDPRPVRTFAEARRARRLTLLGIDTGVEIDNDADPDAEDTGSDREPHETRDDTEPPAHAHDHDDDDDVILIPPPPDWFDYWDFEAAS